MPIPIYISRIMKGSEVRQACEEFRKQHDRIQRRKKIYLVVK